MLFLPITQYNVLFPLFNKERLRESHLFIGKRFSLYNLLSQIKILFFFQLLFLIGVRKLMEYVFSKEELKILDDVLPSFKRSQQLDDEDDKTSKLEV